jgi:hypothetical protein
MQSSYPEALYNLAVVVSEKVNVANLISDSLIDTLLPFTKSTDAIIQHRACWCFFGLAASALEYRDICLRHGVLSMAIDLILANSPHSVIDMCAQIIYGMFHLKPPPRRELIADFFARCPELLQLPESSLKYILWAIHFVSGTSPNPITPEIVERLRPVLKATQGAVLTPLLVIINGIFVSGCTDLDPHIGEIRSSLTHSDPLVRVQAARAVAEYIRTPSNVAEMFAQGIYPLILRMSENDELNVREQSVYSVLRGFGLGDEGQRRRLADIGGIMAILHFVNLATSPFNCNLLDCLITMTEMDYEFFVPKMHEIEAVPRLYQLIASPDPNMANLAANLLGLVGDEYRPQDWG